MERQLSRLFYLELHFNEARALGDSLNINLREKPHDGVSRTLEQLSLFNQEEKEEINLRRLFMRSECICPRCVG